MRMNVSATALHSYGPPKSIAVRLRPSGTVPGSFTCTADPQWFVDLLRERTDLSAAVLDAFAVSLQRSTAAKLYGVEIDDRALTELGYWIE